MERADASAMQPHARVSILVLIHRPMPPQGRRSQPGYSR
jgi:hypothetical protein